MGGDTEAISYLLAENLLSCGGKGPWVCRGNEGYSEPICHGLCCAQAVTTQEPVLCSRDCDSGCGVGEVDHN